MTNARQGKRPLGISLLGFLLLLAAVALLARTVLLHAGWMAGVGRLLAVLIFAVVAMGLWRLRNGSRIFLFFLIALDALTSLVALLVYALPQSQHRLAVELIVQFCIAAMLIWYLQRPEVRHAFGGLSAWPKTVQMLVLTIFTVLLAFPFYWMGIATFKQNIDLYATDNNPFTFNLPPTLNHLHYLFGETQFVRWLGNTALVGVIVVAITLLLALPAAYALARLTGRWGERLGIAIFLTYLVPPTLLFIPLSRVVAVLGLQDTIWSLVLVYPSVTVPFSIWLLMGFFKSIPRELEDAAMVDGLTRFGAFVKLVVPISLSGILTVVIFAFTLVTQEFVYALTFISPESKQMVGVGVPIFLVRGDVYYWGALMAACLIASIPIAFLYNLFLDRFIAGFTVGAVKG
ncbi:MAG TPA: carbohydrate ABC transporter permease [Candidatus Acidoferrales bacterium]